MNNEGNEIAVFKPLDSMGVGHNIKKLFQGIGDVYEVPESNLPILNLTNRLYHIIPEELSRMEEEYEYAIFSSNLPLAGINPDDYDIKIATFVMGFLNQIEVGRGYMGRKTYLRSLRNLGEIDRVLTISKTTKTDLIRHSTPVIDFNNQPIEIVKLGIDQQRIFRDDSEPETKIPESFILYAGRLAPRKNPEFLLEVLEQLEEEMELVVCGANLVEENINEFFRDVEKKGLENRVNFLGKVSIADLRRLYSKADIYLHSARFEGYGRTPVEAATCGTIPVMYEEVPSYRDLSDVAVPFSDFDSRKVADLVKSNLGKEVNYTPRSWSESRKQLHDALGL